MSSSPIRLRMVKGNPMAMLVFAAVAVVLLSVAEASIVTRRIRGGNRLKAEVANRYLKKNKFKFGDDQLSRDTFSIACQTRLRKEARDGFLSQKEYAKFIYDYCSSGPMKGPECNKKDDFFDLATEIQYLFTSSICGGQMTDRMQCLEYLEDGKLDFGYTEEIDELCMATFPFMLSTGLLSEHIIDRTKNLKSSDSEESDVTFTSMPSPEPPTSAPSKTIITAAPSISAPPSVTPSASSEPTGTPRPTSTPAPTAIPSVEPTHVIEEGAIEAEPSDTSPAVMLGVGAVAFLAALYASIQLCERRKKKAYSQVTAPDPYLKDPALEGDASIASENSYLYRSGLQGLVPIEENKSKEDTPTQAPGLGRFLMAFGGMRRGRSKSGNESGDDTRYASSDESSAPPPGSPTPKKEAGGVGVGASQRQTPKASKPFYSFFGQKISRSAHSNNSKRKDGNKFYAMKEGQSNAEERSLASSSESSRVSPEVRQSFLEFDARLSQGIEDLHEEMRDTSDHDDSSIISEDTLNIVGLIDNASEKGVEVEIEATQSRTKSAFQRNKPPAAQSSRMSSLIDAFSHGTGLVRVGSLGGRSTNLFSREGTVKVSSEAGRHISDNKDKANTPSWSSQVSGITDFFGYSKSQPQVPPLSVIPTSHRTSELRSRYTSKAAAAANTNSTASTSIPLPDPDPADEAYMNAIHGNPLTEATTSVIERQRRFLSVVSHDHTASSSLKSPTETPKRQPPKLVLGSQPTEDSPRITEMQRRYVRFAAETGPDQTRREAPAPMSPRLVVTKVAPTANIPSVRKVIPQPREKSVETETSIPQPRKKSVETETSKRRVVAPAVVPDKWKKPVGGPPVATSAQVLLASSKAVSSNLEDASTVCYSIADTSVDDETTVPDEGTKQVVVSPLVVPDKWKKPVGGLSRAKLSQVSPTAEDDKGDQKSQDKPAVNDSKQVAVAPVVVPDKWKKPVGGPPVVTSAQALLASSKVVTSSATDSCTDDDTSTLFTSTTASVSTNKVDEAQMDYPASPTPSTYTSSSSTSGSSSPRSPPRENMALRWKNYTAAQQGYLSTPKSPPGPWKRPEVNATESNRVRDLLMEHNLWTPREADEKKQIPGEQKPPLSPRERVKPEPLTVKDEGVPNVKALRARMAGLLALPEGPKNRGVDDIMSVD